jgi:hypothetical protein
MMGISIRAYARLRGVNHGAVRKAIETGRITPNSDGSIDPERADREWFLKTNPRMDYARPSPPQGGSGFPSMPPKGGPESASLGAPSSDPVTAFLRARAVKETFSAKIAQLEFEQRTGKLIRAEVAGEYAASFSAVTKDALLSLPDRLAPMLAAVNDEKAIHQMLAVEVAAVLKKINKAVSDSGL